MARLQKQFEDFHDAIRLTNIEEDENPTLREKREIILKKLRTNLKKDFEDAEGKVPTFDTRNQGSYAMNTGIKPLDGDFDIDVSVIFNIDLHDYPDPTVVKKWVLHALRGHNAEIKRPCVTVQYQREGEPLYHVDLAIYAYGNAEHTGQLYLAKGFPGSAAANKLWEPSNPGGLVKAINGHFGDEGEQAQFRRVICALKRWKDVRFPSKGDAAPVGIGITIAAYNWFTPQRSPDGSFWDLEAIRQLVIQMLAHFTSRYIDGEWVPWLVVNMPVVPGDNPFDRMSPKQMKSFKTKLEALRDALKSASERADLVQAAHDLRAQFGDDFPIPDRKGTAAAAGAAIISSGHSA